MRRKLFLFLAALLGALLWMPAALATTGAPAAAGPSAVEIVAVLLAALALAAAVVLFVAMRRTNQEHERASAEMQRRWRPRSPAAGTRPRARTWAAASRTWSATWTRWTRP